jgi:plasmid stability protein
MTARWFKRAQERTDGFGSDPVDERIERQAARAGRSAEDEQELILRDVLPNVRKTVAETGLTMSQYLQLNRVEYQELIDSQPGRSLLSRRGGLIDYESFVRLRRWIREAAQRAGEDVETWVVRAGTSASRRPWERRPPASPAVVPAGPGSTLDAPGTGADEPTEAAAVRSRPDDVLDRLERLAALRDSGALTEDEFRAQKHRLLDDAR